MHPICFSPRPELLGWQAVQIKMIHTPLRPTAQGNIATRCPPTEGGAAVPANPVPPRVNRAGPGVCQDPGTTRMRSAREPSVHPNWRVDMPSRCGLPIDLVELGHHTGPSGTRNARSSKMDQRAEHCVIVRVGLIVRKGIHSVSFGVLVEIKQKHHPVPSTHELDWVGTCR